MWEVGQTDISLKRKQEIMAIMDFLLKEQDGVKVLLYHHVYPGTTDAMTVTPEMLEIHFQYLKENGYTTIPVSALIKAINKAEVLPEKTVVITFDGGYKNEIEFVEPLLKKYGFTACIFLIAQKTKLGISSEENGKYSYLGIESVINADPDLFEFGLHGYDHQSFEKLSVEEMRHDLIKSQEFFASINLNIIPVFAYPYGARPANSRKLDSMKNIFRELGIFAAFRIGNRAINFPVSDSYELTRIDIKGSDDLKKFKIKLRKGKLKPF